MSWIRDWIRIFGITETDDNRVYHTIMEADKNGDVRDEKGRFGVGNPGRPKGPNKVSQKVKDAIVGFLEDNMDKIQADFDKLSPAQRLNFVAEVLPYATPKLSAVQSEVEQKIEGGITITWKDPELQPGSGEGSA